MKVGFHEFAEVSARRTIRWMFVSLVVLICSQCVPPTHYREFRQEIGSLPNCDYVCSTLSSCALFDSVSCSLMCARDKAMMVEGFVPSFGACLMRELDQCGIIPLEARKERVALCHGATIVAMSSNGESTSKIDGLFSAICARQTRCASSVERASVQNACLPSLREHAKGAGWKVLSLLHQEQHQKLCACIEQSSCSQDSFDGCMQQEIPSLRWAGKLK